MEDHCPDVPGVLDLEPWAGPVPGAGDTLVNVGLLSSRALEWGCRAPPKDEEWGRTGRQHGELQVNWRPSSIPGWGSEPKVTVTESEGPGSQSSQGYPRPIDESPQP